VGELQGQEAPDVHLLVDDAPEPDRYVYSLFNSKSRDYYYKNPRSTSSSTKAERFLTARSGPQVYQEVDKICTMMLPGLSLRGSRSLRSRQ